MAIACFVMAFPKVGKAPDLTVEATPARLQRGEYLTRSVCVCLDCHSARDWSKYAGPTKPGSAGCGGEAFPLPFGTLYAPNLTQLQSWTDGELYRAIAEGVTKDDRALFPIMPYPRYGVMATEDVYSIIAYLRTLKPLQNPVPATVLKFPMNLIVRTIPEPAAPSQLPGAAPVDRGRYLINAAACADCHTPQEKGKPLPGQAFAGGFAFTLPDGSQVKSANLTPDPTGLGGWDEKRFILRFRTAASTTAVNPQTVMPWVAYNGMTDEDLAAMFAYLQTLPPVKRYNP